MPVSLCGISVPFPSVRPSRTSPGAAVVSPGAKVVSPGTAVASPAGAIPFSVADSATTGFVVAKIASNMKQSGALMVTRREIRPIREKAQGI